MSITGYIGNFEECKTKIDFIFDGNDENIEIYNTCSIDEMKKFRAFLNTNGLRKKNGIIYYLNCFTPEAQAMLLKIFEELPEYSDIYFIATGNISFALQTRAEVFYINSFNGGLVNVMKKYKSLLKEDKVTKKHKNLYDFFFKTYSLYENNYLKLEEKNSIVKILGVE